MRRLPLVASFLLFIALCASAAYWGMQLFKPPLRQVAAPPRAAQAEINAEAAAALFGASVVGKGAVASNYQLKGVIFSGNPRDSVAIIGADGKPAEAIRVDREIAPGVTIKEVHRGYVLLSEGGATKRVELPEEAKGPGSVTLAPPAPTRPAIAPAPGQAIPSRAQAAAVQPPQAPVISTGPPSSATPSQIPVPAQIPGQVPGQVPVQPQGQVPVPAQGQMPGQMQGTATAPPTVVISPPPGTQQPGVAPAPPLIGTQVAPLPGSQPQVPGTLQPTR